jgi:hypothetical protein
MSHIPETFIPGQTRMKGSSFCVGKYGQTYFQMGNKRERGLLVF